jgi:hypothetical protein
MHRLFLYRRGLRHRNPGNLEKSESFELSSHWCSMASAARWVSVVMPAATQRAVNRLFQRDIPPKGERLELFQQIVIYGHRGPHISIMMLDTMRIKMTGAPNHRSRRPEHGHGFDPTRIALGIFKIISSYV